MVDVRPSVGCHPRCYHYLSGQDSLAPLGPLKRPHTRGRAGPHRDVCLAVGLGAGVMGCLEEAGG